MYNVGISLKMLYKKIDLLWCPLLYRVNSAIETVFPVHSPLDHHLLKENQHEHLHSEMIGYCTCIHVQYFCFRNP